jgi:hypothetical protein
LCRLHSIEFLEIFQIFPLINEAYQQKAAKQRKELTVALVAISFLSLFLLVALFYIYKHTRQVRRLNRELHRSNKQIKEANHNIAENARLKEEYIGRYMDQCSVYLEKMDVYRRSLGKMAAGGKVDELYKQIKSTHFIEEELKEFYANFDNTFLQLFPTFVDEFNGLLAEGEQIHLKPSERMNTELRIFALIRLGINDSIKIAQFLRYSVTTIYNYRTKVRNKAAGDRELLEKRVMELCKTNSIDNCQLSISSQVTCVHVLNCNSSRWSCVPSASRWATLSSRYRSSWARPSMRCASISASVASALAYFSSTM